MGRRSKAGVDWQEVEREFKAGISTRAIGKRHRISHTAIQNRGRKHNWQVLESLESLPPEIRATETAKLFAAPVTKGEKRQVTLGQCSPEAALEILDKVKEGAFPQTAAMACGIKRTTFQHWLERDPTFAGLVLAAAGDNVAALEGSVYRVGMSGDAKASKDYLAASESGSWSGQKSGQGFEGFTVIVNVDRSGGDPLPDAIDVTPVQQDAEPA